MLDGLVVGHRRAGLERGVVVVPVRRRRVRWRSLARWWPHPGAARHSAERPVLAMPSKTARPSKRSRPTEDLDPAPDAHVEGRHDCPSDGDRSIPSRRSRAAWRRSPVRTRTPAARDRASPNRWGSRPGGRARCSRRARRAPRRGRRQSEPIRTPRARAARAEGLAISRAMAERDLGFGAGDRDRPTRAANMAAIA